MLRILIAEDEALERQTVKDMLEWNFSYAADIRTVANGPDAVSMATLWNADIVLMDIEEYRLLNGWNETRKRGSTRYDRIPLGIREETVIEQPEDYLQFVPYELDSLEGGFDSAAFAKAAHIDVKTARQVLNILYYVGAVRRTGKKGNSYIYEGVSDW